MRRCALAAFWAGLALTACFPAAAAGAPDPFFGTLFDDNMQLTPEQKQLDVSNQAGAGLGVIRVHVFWDLIEYQETPLEASGIFNWAPLDEVVGYAAAKGVRVLPVIFNTPSGYKPADAPAGVQYPPADPAFLRRFMDKLVRRYGPNGTFWGCTGLPDSCGPDPDDPNDPTPAYLPITSWQIWNEPNWPGWWKNSDDPEPKEYLALLQAAYLGVKGADPDGEVVMAGLAPIVLPTDRRNYEKWLTEFYEAGAAGFFDALAIHAYGADLQGATTHPARVRKIADAHGDRDAPIWITEYGWANGGSGSPFIKSTDCQAALIHAVTLDWRRLRDELKLRGAVQFQWRDVATTKTSWPFYAGLNPATFTDPPKPALGQLANAIAGQPPDPPYTLEAACSPADYTQSAYAGAVRTIPGLRSYWRLGESSGTVALDLNRTADGTYRNGVALGQRGALSGDPDTAVSFDGVDDELTPRATIWLILREKATLEGWFNWRGGVALMRDSTSDGGWILAFDKGGRLAYRVGGTTFVTNRSTASLRGAWHHLALTVDGGATAFYVDGELVHNGVGAASTAAVMPWRLMRNGNFAQFSSGTVDEVAIYDEALGAETIRERYAIGSPYAAAVRSTPGLRSYWRLGDGSGTLALDLNRTADGTYRNGVALGQPGAVSGDPDTAAGFDGANDEMSAGASALALRTIGSLEGWFDWRGGVALMRDSTSGGGWILAFDQGGRLAYRVGGTTFVTDRSTASLRGGWHHLALTVAGGATAFYIDGELVHSGAGAGAAAAVMPWRVMRNGNFAQFSTGTADEVAIYDQALTADTVKEHYDRAR
jgi:hypothetical protein